MDIVRNKKAEVTQIRCLSDGDTFLYDDDVYIVTDDFNTGRQDCTVVCLSDGVLLHLDYDCEVTTVQCRLIVEG